MKSNKVKKNNYTKKRSFLLIEILIAFSLISIFAIPVIRNPIYFFKSQIKHLEKIELENIANLTLLDLKIQLYQKKINLTNLANNKDLAPRNTLESTTLQSFKNKEIKRYYKIYSTRKDKKTKDNEIYKLLKIIIYLDPGGHKPSSFDYLLDKKEIYEYRFSFIHKIK